MSDDEGAYNTITHTETGKGVKLLFSKSKVRQRCVLSDEHTHTKPYPIYRSTSILRRLQRIIFPDTLRCYNKSQLETADRIHQHQRNLQSPVLRSCY